MKDIDYSKFNSAFATKEITTKDGKVLKFLVFNVIINNIPLELTSVIIDDKIAGIFELAQSLQK